VSDGRGTGSANLVPFVKGQTGRSHPRTRHGSTSEALVGPKARNHRRRVLRQLRLRARDLDGVGRGYLDLYSRLSAQLGLIDDYLAANGLIRGDGSPQPVLAYYVALTNSARLSLAKLEDHVRARRQDPAHALSAYLDGDA
jgi:hypothetical protein